MRKLTIIELTYDPTSTNYFDVFAHLPGSCLLDSRNSNKNSVNKDFDIIVALPTLLLEVINYQQLQIHNYITNNTTYTAATEAFATMDKFLQQMTKLEFYEDLPFTGGFLGYYSYEFAALLESKLEKIPIEPNTYLMRQGLYHWCIISDHQQSTTKLVFHPDINQQLQSKILNMLAANKVVKQLNFRLHNKFKPLITAAEYKKSFNKIKSYIKNGDCYQVNLAQQFIASYSGDSWQAYKCLRQKCNSTYSAYLTYKDEQILSNSPEQFIKLQQQNVTTSPIKGTIARVQDKLLDEQLKNKLHNSIKDRAENLMIVDLMRNDLGKICMINSISVPELFKVVSFKKVHHLVSEIIGKLPNNKNALDLLAACFPGGSITGAPKIRAMEIINELEAANRNIFCGSIGYINCAGNMNTNICIRTLATRNNKILCWAGGAIVADSVCSAEYQESIVKVNHFLVALENSFLIKLP